jgi:flagellar protein FlgJ
VKKDDRGVMVAVAAVAVVALIYSGGRKMTKVETFVARFKDSAVRVGQESGLPFWLILTQAAHESAMGLSALALKGMNFFGFTGEAWAKAGKPTVAMPTREFIKGAWVAVTRPFRAYASPDDSMRDYARLLTTQPRYAEVVKAARAGDVGGTFAALGRSGYATDPTYGQKLQGVYNVLKPFFG